MRKDARRVRTNFRQSGLRILLLLCLVVLFGLVGGATPALAQGEVMYGCNGGAGVASNLYIIDPATGAATLVGPMGIDSCSGLVFSPDGTLFAVGKDPGTGQNSLYTVDRGTGVATLVGSSPHTFGGQISGISFRSDGTLFGYLETGDGLGALNTATGAVTATDDHIFISDASMLRISEIATLGSVEDIAGSLGTWGGFDDGRHMVVDSAGERIFVSNHDSDFDVFDFSLIQLFPTWGVSLLEPLGIAPLPDGKILITDEEDSNGLFRLNSDLTLDASASGSFSFDGAEGVAYDSVHNRIFVADEDDEEIEIFDGTTLGHIATADFICSGDGPYWLGVDGSSNRVFALADGRCPGFTNNNFGIHVFDIISVGDDLSFDQTLPGSGGGSTDCYGALAVSESTDRLFAIDYCSDAVDIYDTATLAFLGTVTVGRAGAEPLMVSVGHLTEEPAPTPTPMPVGGIIVPVNRLELLALRLGSGQAPWPGLAALTALAALTVVLVRRRRSA